MKKSILTTTIILVLFSSCKKQGQLVPQFTKPDMIEIPEFIAKKKRPHGDNPPPTDTISNPPPAVDTPHQNYILLDFNGGTISSTVWPVTYYAESGLTDEQVSYIIARVREALAGFNVIVDTSEATYNSFPVQYRQKEIFTTTWQWYGSSGGVALKNSFGTETPCWVFTPNLSMNTHYTGEAGVHELGHTLNLGHQRDYDQVTCMFIGEYIYGPWNMGCTYYYFLTGIWRNQTAPDCYNTINESFIIQQTLQ